MINQEQKQPEPIHPTHSGGGNKPEKNWPFILSIGILILLVAGIVAFLLVSKDKFADNTPWILIAIAVLIIVVGIIAVVMVKTRKGKHEPDYRALFIMGIIWLPLGIATENAVFWIMSLAFMVIGLANKNKWKKPKLWTELTAPEKKLKLGLIISLSVLVILAIVAFLLTKKQILF